MDFMKNIATKEIEGESGMNTAFITQDQNGVYHWTGTIDAGYEKKTFKIVFGVCGGICLLFIIMCLVIGPEMLGVTLLTCLGIMAVAGAVCWFFNLNAGHREQSYEMNEDYIIFKVLTNGKIANNPFSFRSINKAVVYTSRNMIELYQLLGSGPVFVPHEDFGFVRDYILQRIPDDAEVEYM